MSVSSRTGVSAGISLREIFPDATFLKSDDVRVASCASTLDECRANDLFVALLGPECDGHEDAVRAVRRGASAVLSERLLPVSTPQCIVPDSRVAYGKICHALAGHPSHHLHTIAVGGTDGKTTTAHLIESVLTEAGQSAGLLSTIVDSTRTDAKSGLPTVTPPYLAETLSRMVIADKQNAVIETGSVALAQHRFAGVGLDVVVINNLRGNHFGFHSSLVNYRRAQLRLLDYLKPGGVAVVNVDDPGCYFALDSINQPTLTFGIRQDANVTARIIESSLFETTFLLKAGDESAMVRTGVPGLHHVYNCLAATATALLHDIDLPTIVRGLERIESLPGRMNLVKCGQQFSVAVDQANTPYRLGVALNTLKRNTTGQVYCVFSTPESADIETAGQFGRIAERNAAVPVITRPCTRKGTATVGERIEYEPIHQVLDGFERPEKARVMPDRIAAVEWALSQARPGDAVLVAGCGDHPIALLGNGRWQLTDSEVCQSWLYGDSVPGQEIPVVTEPPSIFNIGHYRHC